MAASAGGKLKVWGKDEKEGEREKEKDGLKTHL